MAKRTVRKSISPKAKRIEEKDGTAGAGGPPATEPDDDARVETGSRAAPGGEDPDHESRHPSRVGRGRGDE
jgi:hypothetical protein